MNVPVSVDGQRMTLQGTSYRFSQGSQKFIKFVFELSDDWDGLTTFAQFSQGGHAYNSYLDAEHSAYLPGEIQAGQCSMTLYGTNNEDSVIGISMPVKICIADSGYVEDASSTVITQTLYMQLVDQVQTAIASVSGKVDRTEIASIEEVRSELGIE